MMRVFLRCAGSRFGGSDCARNVSPQAGIIPYFEHDKASEAIAVARGFQITTPVRWICWTLG